MSSISSRSLSMSSLIFLPFLASSGLAAAPSPPSAGSAGLPSSSAQPSRPPWGNGPCGESSRTATACILACPLSQAFEVLTEGQHLALVGRAQARAIDALGAGAEALEPHLERRLAVIDHERHLACPHL